MTRRTEKAIAAVLLLIGGAYGYGVFQIRERHLSGTEIGPATFPWLLAVLLISAAVAIFLRSAAGAGRGDANTQPVGGAPNDRIIFAVILLIAYVAALHMAGFIWTTPIFLFVFSMLFQWRHTLLMAGLAPAVSLTLYLLLRHGFGVPLP